MASQLDPGSHSFWRWVGLALASLGAVAILWSFLPIGEWMLSGTRQIAAFGWAAIPVFILVYIVLAVCGFPSTPLNVAAGVLFGYATACLSAMAAAFVAAIVTFLIARYIAYDWVSQRIAYRQAARSIISMIREDGFKIVLLARLNPFIPAVVKSYGFGVTPIRLNRYAMATLLGQIPVTMAHVYLGWAGLAMLDGKSTDGQTHGVLLTAGIVVSVMLLIAVSWYAYKHLNRRTADAEIDTLTATG